MNGVAPALALRFLRQGFGDRRAASLHAWVSHSGGGDGAGGITGSCVFVEWLRLLAIWIFAVVLDLVDVFTGPLTERLVLPILLIALYTTGSLTRVYRAELLDGAAQPMFRTARAKGLSRGHALWRTVIGGRSSDPPVRPRPSSAGSSAAPP